MNNSGTIGLLIVGICVFNVLAAPEPKIIPGFQMFAHGVHSGNVTIQDTKTILIKDFNYDGAGPDTFFWVGKGRQPSKDGKPIPDENGSRDTLKGYEGKDITLKLPNDLTVKDIGYVSVWCRRFETNFGHITISKNLNVPAN